MNATHGREGFMMQHLKENWGLLAAGVGLSGYAAHLVDAINGLVALLLGVGALVLVCYKIRLRHLKLKAWDKFLSDEQHPHRKHKRKLTPEEIDRIDSTEL